MNKGHSQSFLDEVVAFVEDENSAQLVRRWKKVYKLNERLSVTAVPPVCSTLDKGDLTFLQTILRSCMDSLAAGTEPMMELPVMMPRLTTEPGKSMRMLLYPTAWFASPDLESFTKPAIPDLAAVLWFVIQMAMLDIGVARVVRCPGCEKLFLFTDPRRTTCSDRCRSKKRYDALTNKKKQARSAKRNGSK